MNEPGNRGGGQFGESGLLRLHCPFCQTEYPLWFRADEEGDQTLSPSEWEQWLSRPCSVCHKAPREHVEQSRS